MHVSCVLCDIYSFLRGYQVTEKHLRLFKPTHQQLKSSVIINPMPQDFSQEHNHSGMDTGSASV